MREPPHVLCRIKTMKNDAESYPVLYYISLMQMVMYILPPI